MSRQENNSNLTRILVGVGAGILAGAAAAVAAYGVTKLVDSVNEQPMKEKKWDDDDSDSSHAGASAMPQSGLASEQPLHAQLRHYYSTYVQVPEREMTQALRVVAEIKQLFLNYVRQHAPDIPVLQLHDTGSATEGLKVIRADEFDVMIELGLDVDSWNIENADDAPGYWRIQREPCVTASGLTKLCSENNYLQPRQIISRFQSIWSKLNNTSHGYEIRPSVHGPAITLGVTYTTSSGKRNLDIDFVPAVRLRDTWVVAKMHPKSNVLVQSPYNNLWRQSFSMKECEQINKFGRFSHHRECLMIMKAIRLNHTSQLKPLSSYVFKTILLHMLDDEDDWKDEAIPERIFDFLHRLQNHLSDGNLPNYFCPDMNILQDVSKITCSNIRQFILKSETKRGIATLLKKQV